MSQLPIIPPQSMPSATILNYVARNVDDQPTRVRVIASWCVLGFALFPLVLAGILWLRVVPYLFDPTWIVWNFQGFVISVIPALVVTGIVVMMMILPPYIRRGRNWACLVSILLVLPILLACILIAGFLASYALLEVLTPLKQHPQFIQLLWLIPALFFGFLTLIANDLRRYLQWIYKLPRQEIPPVKFISISR